MDVSSAMTFFGDLLPRVFTAKPLALIPASLRRTALSMRRFLSQGSSSVTVRNCKCPVDALPLKGTTTCGEFPVAPVFRAASAFVLVLSDVSVLGPFLLLPLSGGGRDDGSRLFTSAGLSEIIIFESWGIQRVCVIISRKSDSSNLVCSRYKAVSACFVTECCGSCVVEQYAEIHILYMLKNNSAFCFFHIVCHLTQHSGGCISSCMVPHPS